MVKYIKSFINSNCFDYLVQQPSHIFVPPTCSSSTNIGINCSISSTACAMLKPCQNNGICINTNNTYNGYICSCPPGFNGTQCQFDHRACKTNTCWNNGSFFLLSKK